MKKVIMPLVRLVQWLGSILRFVWNWKRPDKNDLKADPKLANKEKVINGWVGAAGLIVAGLIGFAQIQSSSNDMKSLEKVVSTSFEKMERLDYLTSSLDSTTMNSSTLVYQQLRGKIKLASMMLKDQIDLNNKFEFSNPEDNNASKKEATDQLISTSEIFTYATAISKEVLFLAEKKENSNKLVCSLYKIKMEKAVAQREKIYEAFDNVMAEAANDMTEKSFEKQIKKVVKGKPAIEYAVGIYNELDILYEFLVALQLYDIYGKDVSYTSIQELLNNNATIAK